MCYCYYDLNADILNKLHRLLYNSIRFVFNFRNYDHVVSTHRSRLKWLPIHQRRELRALITLFSILDKPTSPSYLTSRFHIYALRTLRLFVLQTIVFYDVSPTSQVLYNLLSLSRRSLFGMHSLRKSGWQPVGSHLS